MFTGTKQSWSELWEPVAREYFTAKSVADQLEAGKSVFVSQAIIDLVKETSCSFARAEKEVKASQQYKDYLRRMHNAKTAANMAYIERHKVELDISEAMDRNASHRQELKTLGQIT